MTPALLRKAALANAREHTLTARAQLADYAIWRRVGATGDTQLVEAAESILRAVAALTGVLEDLAA